MEVVRLAFISLTVVQSLQSFGKVFFSLSNLVGQWQSGSVDIMQLIIVLLGGGGGDDDDASSRSLNCYTQTALS